MPPESDEISEWLELAHRDLESAEHLLSLGRRLHVNVGFHSQQCAKKSLKAYLTARAIRFPKTHDLDGLLALWCSTEVGFASFEQRLGGLTSFAVAQRYPGAVVPADPVIHCAYATARALLEFVERLLNRSA